MLLHSTVISYRGHRCCIYKQNSLATVTKGNEMNDGDGRKQAKLSLAIDTIGTYDEGRIYVLAILRYVVHHFLRRYESTWPVDK